MADKKVDRSRPDLTINPTQQTTSALSEKGTINMAEPTHDKGKAAVVDKFRKREERWRREQALNDREAIGTTPTSPAPSEDEGAAAADVDGPDKGGAQ